MCIRDSFTGDLHAIGAANNLLAAMVDNHIYQGNALNIDPRRITWKRCVDTVSYTHLGQIHKSHGLFRRAAARPRDACDTHAEIRRCV